MKMSMIALVAAATLCASAGAPVQAAAMNSGLHGIPVHRPYCRPGHPCIHGIIIRRHCLAWEVFGGARRCVRWSRF